MHGGETKFVMKIAILLIILVVSAKGTDLGGQKVSMVYGRECLKSVNFTDKSEMVIPIVDGRLDKEHAKLWFANVEYDSNCGVYRVERVESK